jgi:AhpD family alkylhydroperoxidase
MHETMARITMLPAEQIDPQLAGRDVNDGTPGWVRPTSRILAHTPDIAAGLKTFMLALKANRTLPERLIELVRLRVAFHNQCRSCMAVRYEDALADGVTEELVCSLERPMEADDLDERERLAIRYGELLATNHLAIDDEFYDRMRELFTEPEIVELGLNVALFVGIGRLAATWDLVDGLPDRYRAEGKVTPWGARDDVMIVN